MRVLGALLVLLAVSAPALAGNFDHPGLVHAGKDGWVPPERAAELGYFEYRGRWLPVKLKGQLAKWERADARIRGWQDAYKVKSKHYRIETDVPHFVLELEIKPFLDELYRTYVEVFRKDFGLTGRAANKKTIRIFHGYENYAQNSEPGNVVPRSTPGFILGGDELMVYYEETNPGEFYGTVFHEGAHQFMSAMLPGASLPVWLDEALATYFEGCVYSRATGKITVNHLPPDRVQHAQEVLKSVHPRAGDSLPERLFTNVPYERFEAREYALAWSFVYYLANRDGGRHRKGFTRFLQETNGAGVRPIPEIFKRTTGVALADVEAGWREFVLELKPPPELRWFLLDVGGERDAAVDLRTDDLVWSVDGILVTDAAAFERVWKERRGKKDVPFVVVRRTPLQGPYEYRDEFVRTVVPKGSGIELGDGGWLPRIHNLRD